MNKSIDSFNDYNDPVVTGPSLVAFGENGAKSEIQFGWVAGEDGKFNMNAPVWNAYYRINNLVFAQVDAQWYMPITFSFSKDPLANDDNTRYMYQINNGQQMWLNNNSFKNNKYETKINNVYPSTKYTLVVKAFKATDLDSPIQTIQREFYSTSMSTVTGVVATNIAMSPTENGTVTVSWKLLSKSTDPFYAARLKYAVYTLPKEDGEKPIAIVDSGTNFLKIKNSIIDLLPDMKYKFKIVPRFYQTPATDFVNISVDTFKELYDSSANDYVVVKMPGVDIPDSNSDVNFQKKDISPSKIKGYRAPVVDGTSLYNYLVSDGVKNPPIEIKGKPAWSLVDGHENYMGSWVGDKAHGIPSSSLYMDYAVFAFYEVDAFKAFLNKSGEVDENITKVEVFLQRGDYGAKEANLTVRCHTLKLTDNISKNSPHDNLVTPKITTLGMAKNEKDWFTLPKAMWSKLFKGTSQNDKDDVKGLALAKPVTPTNTSMPLKWATGDAKSDNITNIASFGTIRVTRK